MRPFPALLLSLASAHRLAEPALSQAVIEGRVEIPGLAAPAPAPPRYANLTVPVGPPEPPKAVVYLEGSFPAPASSKSARMGQRKLQFEPGLLAIRRGTTVEFPNFDETYHNVFSYSKTKRFDLGRYRKDEKPAAQVFDKEGVVRLSCEIHQHMQGVIVVLDTPYFQKTDGEGNYRLEGLPPGKYVLTARVGEKQIYRRPVELGSETRLRIDFPGK